MKKLRLLAILAILIAVMIPVAVSAGGTLYCSASVITGGTGTLSDPWACSDDAQLESVINDQVCGVYSGGDLYQIFPSSYRYHVVTWYSATDCRVTATYDYAGYPPTTGPDVSTPYVIGAVALVGAGLVTTGFIIIRRRKLAEV